MKTLFLVADGMGGWPLEELGGKTTMEAARTPNMDRLAAEGVVGLCRTVPKTMQPGSDVANMSLLGFDPAENHTGRGPIEAAAQGLELDENDLVWRLNLVTVTDMGLEGVMRDYSAGHIDTERASSIVHALQNELGDAEFAFYPGVQYRHLLVQKTTPESVEPRIAIRPPHDILDQPIRPDLKEFSKSATLWDLVMSGSQLVSEDNSGTKANAIWPWGQGRPLNLPGFKDSFGLEGAVISAVDLIKGLGRAAGMAVIDVDGATGLLDTNYEGKVQAALDFLQTGDFVFVHLEGPDECGHGGSVQDKVQAIERFDARVAAPLLKGLEGQDIAVLCTCDHFTPIARRTHTHDPVPFLLRYPGCPASGVAAFTEKTAAETGLFLEKGHELMGWALKQIRG